jgi:anti-sigma factor (TIGR02949 family)
MEQHQHQHNCRQVFSKVNLALDFQLSIDEEQAFLDEVRKCPSCLEKYDIESSFKTFLKEKILRKSVSSNLIETIKNKIRNNNAE